MFHVPSVSFLGYIMLQGSIQMDPAKVSVVNSDSPLLLQAAAMVSGFRQFLPQVHPELQHHRRPSHSLHVLRAVLLLDSAEVAFQSLKAWFNSASILQVADPDGQFILEVHASDVGYVVYQNAAVNHKLHPRTFFSYRLTPAERAAGRQVSSARNAGTGWKEPSNPF